MDRKISISKLSLPGKISVKEELFPIWTLHCCGSSEVDIEYRRGHSQLGFPLFK
jgi:hypothetical protein